MMKKITFLMAVLATTLSFGQAMTNGDFSTAGTLLTSSPGTGEGWYGTADASIEDNQGALTCSLTNEVNINQDVNFVEAGQYTFSYTVKTDAPIPEGESYALLGNVNIQLKDAGVRQPVYVAATGSPSSETWINGDLNSFQSKKQNITGSYKTHTVVFDIAAPNTVLTLSIIIFQNMAASDTSKVYIDDVSFTKVPTLAVAANNENTPSFSCYPNPAKNTINVAAAEAIDSVVLLNTMGQTVASTVIGSTSGKIDVTNVASGVYILSTTINGVVSSQRVVIE